MVLDILNYFETCNYYYAGRCSEDAGISPVAMQTWSNSGRGVGVHSGRIRGKLSPGHFLTQGPNAQVAETRAFSCNLKAMMV